MPLRSVSKCVYAKLDKDLRESIGNKKLLPGQFIQSEHELTARYGISRRSVRKALADLERDGLIHKKPGKGTVVGDSAHGGRLRMQKTIAINFEKDTQGFEGHGSWDFYREQVVQGVCDYAEELELSVELVGLDKLYGRVSGLDGALLISPPRAYMAERFSLLVDTGLPVVVVNRAVPDERVGYVMVDHRKWTGLGVDHLIGLGHRKIAFIGGLQNPPLNERLLGYRDALAAHGLEYDERLILQEPLRPDYIHLIRRFLDEVRVTAIFIPGCVFAVATLIAVCEKYRVPDEMSIMCFDDIQGYVDQPVPPISCIRQPLHSLGFTAARMLVRMIKGGQPSREILPAELIIRSSCARPKEDVT